MQVGSITGAIFSLAVAGASRATFDWKIEN